MTPTSGTDSTPATVKGTLPGAALPPCRRPQHCSQPRERPPPGAGLSPGLSPQDQPQGVTSGSNPQEPTRRSSGVATISPSAATQRNPKTPKGKASASQGRQGQGNDGRTLTAPRFRRPPPFSQCKRNRRFPSRAPFSARPPDAEGGGQSEPLTVFSGSDIENILLIFKVITFRLSLKGGTFGP